MQQGVIDLDLSHRETVFSERLYRIWGTRGGITIIYIRVIDNKAMIDMDDFHMFISHYVVNI